MRPLTVISFGALLLLAGCDKISRKPSGTAATPPPPPPPLPVVATADVPPPPSPAVELKPGANLGMVAQEAYGHEKFAGFVATVNEIGDPSKIRAGTLLKTPSLASAFQEAGADPIYQPAINALAKAATDYFAAFPAYNGALNASTPDGKPDIPASVTTTFNSSADAIDAAILVLDSAKEPHTAPKMTIGQFRQASEHLRAAAKGEVNPDDYGKDPIGQRFGVGFTNALLWVKQQHQ